MKERPWFIVIGICCGILLGLSLSPVIDKTLSAIIAFTITLMGIVSGVTIYNQNNNSKFQVSPVPLSLLLIGIIAGVFIGILMRTHNILGVSNSAQIQIMKDTAGKSPKDYSENVTGLHNAFSEPCEIMKPLHGSELKTALESAGDETVNSCLKLSSDSTSLEIIKRMACK
jgi:hypothetical protein